MKHKLITCTLLVCLLVCLLGNLYQVVMYHRLLGTVNNLKTSLNITNQNLAELEDKYYNLQEAVAIIIAKPSVNKNVYNSIQSKRFPDYQMEKPYIPDNNYFELQQHKDRLDNLQKQTDEINKKLKDAEIQKDAERLAKPYYMF